MKTLFVSLVALLFAFFLGCESTITDPVIPEPTKFVGSSEEEETAAYKDIFHNTYPYSIGLEGSLLDPSHKLNSLVEIEGLVRYGIKKINTINNAQEPINHYKLGANGTPDQSYEVDLFVDAVMKPHCPKCKHPWTVKKATDQQVEVNSANQSVFYFVKSFRIKNTCCAPLNLILKFEFFEEKLQLVSMELKLVPGLYPVIDQE